jgi:hypothetical protein
MFNKNPLVMKYFYSLCFLLFAPTFSGYAQTSPSELNHAGFFKWNDDLNDMFHEVMTLKFKTAIPRLIQEKKQNTFNLIPHYLEDYIDFFYAFIDGKPKDIYGKYLKRKEERLLWLEQGAEGDPYTLFTQADIHLRWGMIYALFQDNMEAFKSIKKASVLLERNNKKFPKFLPNKRAMGILHTMVGAIPGKYQWGASLVGLRGNIAQGLGEIEEVIDHGKRHQEFEFNEEVQVIYGMLLLYMGNNDLKAWGAINTEILDFTKNPMAAYILANRSMKTGKSKQALLILDKYPKGEEYYHFPYMDIMNGMCKLYRLDLDSEINFNNFLSRYRGVNGIKEAYHRLAWISLLRKDESKYRYYMSLVEKKGEYNTAQDRTAMNEMEEAKQKNVPNVDLLQARLLYDGGYYDKAYNALKSCDSKSLKTEQEKIEHSYRTGRILQKMRKNDDALKSYAKTIDKGTKKPYYYACNAALQSGKIHESRDELEQAKEFYEKCLKEKPDQYQVSLHSQAKERLEALKKKKK